MLDPALIILITELSDDLDLYPQSIELEYPFFVLNWSLNMN